MKRVPSLANPYTTFACAQTFDMYLYNNHTLRYKIYVSNNNAVHSWSYNYYTRYATQTYAKYKLHEHSLTIIIKSNCCVRRYAYARSWRFKPNTELRDNINV